jgi:hypothetical protein
MEGNLIHRANVFTFVGFQWARLWARERHVKLRGMNGPSCFVFSLVLWLSIQGLAFCQVSADQARLELAQRWLLTLGVDFEKEISSTNVVQLHAAFEGWRKASSEPTAVAKVGTDAPRALSTTFLERLPRISTFSAEDVRTPNSVLVNNVFVGNPDHGLLSVGGSLNLGELYISPEIRNSLCDTALTLWSRANELSCNDMKYLLGTRKRDWWGRLASAITIKTTVSQIPRIQSNQDVTVVLKNNDIRWSPKVTGTFDPTLLFRGPSDWKAWSSHYRDGFRNELGPECQRINEPHFDARCYERFLRTGSLKLILGTYLPRIDVTAYSPFDFVKYGVSQTFVEPPSGGKTIYDVTLTWDLKRLFPSAQNRSDALKTYQTIHSATNLPKRRADGPNLPWMRRVEALYLELASTPQVSRDADWWNMFRATLFPGK